jgi:rod shape-determining protein MreB
MTVSSEEILEALSESLESIVETVHIVLENTPPELAADISDRGVVLTGGGSLLHGLDTLVTQRTGINAIVADEAVSCVAIGTGKFIEFAAAHRELDMVRQTSRR